MVVPSWQLPHLPTESLCASVVFAGRAITVSTPITKGFSDALEIVVVREDRATLSHGDVMSRVKTQSSNVAE